MAGRTPTTIAGGKNRIAELTELRLGGISQWISIRGANRGAPLLLFLHGGPGMALIGVASRYLRRLEQHFTVVCWDQRGSGLSYHPEIPEASMTVEQFVKDATQLVEYLLHRFERKKLFLVGHSWGSAIGVLTVKANPQYFYAYLGAGQIADMAQNEALEYQNLLDFAKRQDHPILLRQLLSMGPPPYREAEQSTALRADFTLRYLSKYRSQSHYQRRVTRTLLRSTEYGFWDLLRYVKAHLHSVKSLWPKLVSTNLFALAPELQVPCYFILGRHDLVVLPVVSERYIEALKAPKKELIWFDTGHSMQYETPERFQSTIYEKFAPHFPVQPPPR